MADLEFAWGDLRPADPAEQAKVIDIYVRDGIYAVNEARGLPGLDPVPGGGQTLMVRQGASLVVVTARRRQHDLRAAHTRRTIDPKHRILSRERHIEDRLRHTISA